MNSVASAFPVACCGVSERMLKRCYSLRIEDSPQLVAESFNKKSIVLGIVIFIVIILALALDSRAAPQKEPRKAEQQEQPKMGGTLVFGVGKEPGNPNPFVDTSSTNQLVKDSSYESLLTLDYNDRIVPQLAEAFEVSSGGTEITLRLRKGVKFHNGKEMKADDVVWSANHVKDPRSGAYGNNLIQDVKSVDKIDDYTVKFTLFKPSLSFLFQFASIRREEKNKTMTHVITASCIGAKHKELSCTEVCPMDCIHGTATDEILCIDPEECIDCGACVPTCPRGAIFAEANVPEKSKQCIQVNADYFKDKR